MQKKIYIVRHCAAQGQPPESPLTEQGLTQAKQLGEFFIHAKIDRIISSPFLRAIQTVEPVSKSTTSHIEIDNRLAERILSTTDLPDWYEKLSATFDNMELTFEGGESSQEAMNRIVNVVEEVLESGAKETVIVSHGNIISLLLKHYNPDFNFECWKNLSNPDVFLLTYEESEVRLNRIWNEREYNNQKS